jgi:sigma-E factor negative regulatory protein RseB
MPSIYKTLVCCVLFISTSLPVVASEKQALELLQKMSAAIKQLNYEGVFVFIHGNQMETMYIVHKNVDNEEHERLLSLVGTPREIIRSNDRLICILPDSQSVVVDKSRPKKYLPVGLQRVTSELKRYYSFSVAGQERMTGRESDIIYIKPKDPYRYGYRLWLDQQTHMLLKSDLVNEKDEAVEQIMFTQITIDDSIQPERLQPTISTKGYTWMKQDKALESTEPHISRWSVNKLPAGYMQGMHNKHNLPTSRMPVEHLMFTDGISSVSVYIEEMNDKKPMMKGFSSIGAVNAYTTIMSNHYVTVVGEVPKTAVKVIADSVSFRD